MDSTIKLQWVPSHCGLIGNELADLEANRAAGRGVESAWDGAATVMPVRDRHLVSWSAARCTLRRFVLRPTATRERVCAVYGLDKATIRYLSSPPWSLTFSVLSEGERVFAGPSMPDLASRSESVLLAQLRSGHCAHLAAYARVVNPLADPTCPWCREEPGDVEHWLQRCPAKAAERLHIFGDPSPPLAVLARAPARVGLYARLCFHTR